MWLLIAFFSLQEEETSQHIFFACPPGNLVWKFVLLHMGVQRRPQLHNKEVLWLVRVHKARNIRARRVQQALTCTIYMLWQERNLRMFQQTSCDPERLSGYVIQLRELLF